jgi:hypothetical protein
VAGTAGVDRVDRKAACLGGCVCEYFSFHIFCLCRFP